MRKTSFALALLTAAVLTACGGHGPSGGDQTPKTKFSNEITFGDSLADVGTYKVGAVAALGGGQYTINGDATAVSPELTGKNYTELLAAQLKLPAPCAAQTGLLGTASAGFSVPVTDHPECFNYAQGGARVTNPIGPGNKALDKPGATSIGQMTVPVTAQIDNHLKKVGGKVKGDELVIVMAGGNDALELLGEFAAGATTAGGNALATSLVTQLAPGTTDPATGSAAIGLAIQTEAAKPGSTSQSIITAAITAAAQNGNTGAVANATTIGNTAGAAALAAAAKYQTDNAPVLVQNMATAGAELGALVKNKILANGAGYVIVNNLPDVSISPSAKAKPADTQKLVATMVDAFNSQLKAAVGGEAKVLYVDLASVSRDQATNPAPYGLTNTTTPACDLSPAKNPLGSSLVCNKNNLIAGDVSHYMFADTVHPTPFEHALIARYVLEQMTIKGWL
jgi:phospholipase/lecithinase/hemolysin